MIKWSDTDETALIEFVRRNPIIYDTTVGNPGSKREVIKGLFEDFSKTRFNCRMSGDQVRSRWQKLRSYYSVILKNKGTADKECIKWKHLQSMEFMENVIRGRVKTETCDDDDEHLQYDDDGYLRLPDDQSISIKEERVYSDNSAIQESFNPLKYCSVGIQNSTMRDDSNDEESQQQEQHEEEPSFEHPNLSNKEIEAVTRKRGRPKRTIPVVVEKRKRGRPKGYSPLAKYNLMTPYMPQTTKKFQHFSQQSAANASYQNTMHTSQESVAEPHHEPETSITNVPNNQPATSTTADVQGFKEADHMAHILTSMLHRIENPIERTEIFIKMLQLCKDGLQKN